MKKIFTLFSLAIVALGFNLNAQSTRLVLAEEFTQASCPPCATQNPAFNTLLNANPTKVVAIKYQTSWPGVDPMNANTQSLVAPRVTYYAVNGVPHALMDGVPQTGTSYTGAPANWTTAKLNARAAVMSPYTVGVVHSFNSTMDSIFITVDVACTQADSGSLVLQVAIIEHEISWCHTPGTNGEDVFEGVMQDMLPNSAGTALAANWAVGATQQFTYAAALKNYIYDKQELAVVAFIQDNGTQDVRQAGYSAPIPIALDSKLACDAITNVPIISCGTAIEPIVTFENSGSTPINSLTINYSIDGVPATPISWTGTIAPGATASDTLFQINAAPGAHTLLISVDSPNGASDYNTHYNSQSATFNVSTTSGGALPLAEAFTPTTWPPTGWLNVNPDAGYGWTRHATAGVSGGGCAKINFFSSPNGQVDELYVPNYDFSPAGITSANVDFDVAYCQYSTENDKIEVMYSTDCGQTWTTIFSEAGTTLANGNADTTSSWKPWNINQWHHKIANMDQAIGRSNVFIKFKATSAYGNNGYIDNVNVTTNLNTSVPQLFSAQDVNVFPNPSNGKINVQLNLAASEEVTVTITNALGSVVKTVKFDSNGIFPIDLSNEAKGSYEVSVKSSSKFVTKRISITQ